MDHSYPGSEIPPESRITEDERLVPPAVRGLAWIAILFAAVLIVLALVGVACGDDVRISLSKYGVPDQTGVLHGRYMLGYDGRTRCPRWVLERLDRKQVAASIDREGGFRSDTLVPPEFRVMASDYAGSGYDIGHMAPFNTHRTSDEDGSSTFMFSNAAPQLPEFNRGLWRTLEAEIHGLAERDPVWVVTCPLWIPESGKLVVKTIGRSGVWVPTHCGKAILSETAKGVRLRAWIMPNRELKGRETREFVVSIDDFERMSGLDLWAELPDEIENKLESVK